MNGRPSGVDDRVSDVLAWVGRHAAEGDLQLDSRNVRPGDVFIGVPGARSDGRSFLGAAIAHGAVAALVEADGWDGPPAGIDARFAILPVSELAPVLGALAARYYDDPSAKLLSIGVTGTNGKTSCTQWIAQLLDGAGHRAAVIGTLGSGLVGGPRAPAELTTPDPVALQRESRRLLDEGARALVMEVSSIGLEQGRVDGMTFDIALFTNLTRDHLDYHGTMARYEAAKARLFDWPNLKHAVLNLDDPAGLRLAHRLQPRVAAGLLHVTGHTATGIAPLPFLTLALSASNVRATAQGLAFEVAAGTRRAELALPLVGQFNVANVLGVLGVALAAGVDFDRACAGLPKLVPPPGRMQRIGGIDAPLAIIDYAHTPDALAQALAALRPLARARGGELWVVFGAGGDRDPGKRAPMGEAASYGADRVVITSDNPRSEDPAAIVDAVGAGVGGHARVERIVDRGEAIRRALLHAGLDDVVLIAGKGHEATQEIAGRKLPFSDLENARAALALRAETTNMPLARSSETAGNDGRSAGMAA